MKVDISTVTVSAVVAVAVSLTFWWQFRQHDDDEKTTNITSSTCNTEKQDEIEVMDMDESGQERKWISKANITIATTINSSEPASATANQHKGNSTTASTQPDDGNVSPLIGIDTDELKNFRAKDIPDFTIQLDESDDDMF